MLESTVNTSMEPSNQVVLKHKPHLLVIMRNIKREFLSKNYYTASKRIVWLRTNLPNTTSKPLRMTPI
jgi:hypothetical protein